MKKKKETPEDFIGWKSEDGKLEVIGIHGKQGQITTFKVTCHKCKEDKELFPDEHFVSTKGHLVNGCKPCGCSKKPEWNKEQYLILARRAANGRFIVHGFAEEFRGSKTKLNLECLKDGHKWTARTNHIINTGSGCPKCSDNARPTEQEVLERCKEICKIEEYEPIGFVGRYTNKSSRFEYKCLKHGKQNVSYNDFVNKGTRCKDCWKYKQKEMSGRDGYYPERKDEKDFLYILNFNNKYIKVGRSFDVDERMKNLRTKSKVPIKNIHKLRIFTATHQEIYDLEQELHSELRERGFQYYLNWTKECFETGSLFVLNNLLNICGLQELTIE